MTWRFPFCHCCLDLHNGKIMLVCLGASGLVFSFLCHCSDLPGCPVCVFVCVCAVPPGPRQVALRNESSISLLRARGSLFRLGCRYGGRTCLVVCVCVLSRASVTLYSPYFTHVWRWRSSRPCPPPPPCFRHQRSYTPPPCSG